MTVLYLLCLIAPILILAMYCIRNDKYNLNTIEILLAVIITNVGFFFLITSNSLDSAIAATRLTYIAGCFLPMLIFLSISEIVQQKINSHLIAIIYLLQSVLYSITCTIGYNELFYTSSKLDYYNGIPYLVKSYGPLYSLFLLMLAIYFCACCVYVGIAFNRRNKVSLRNTLIVFSAYMLLIVGYFANSFLPSGYDLAPFVNILLLLFLIYPTDKTSSYYYIQDNINQAYEQSKDICFISFNAKLEYIGSNLKAQETISEIKSFIIDKPVPDSSIIIKNEVLPRLNAYIAGQEHDHSYININSSSWDIIIHTVSKHQSKVIGYLIELIDVSEKLDHVKMVENYNRKLQEEVEEKTKRVQDIQQRMVMGFDHSETAYSIIKVEVDENNHPVDWSYIYINDSMARLLGSRKDDLVGKRFLESFPDGDKKWLNYYYPAAFEGKTFSFEATPQEIGMFMKVQCFPLDYGYCGCVFEDASTTKELMRNKAEIEMINDALCSDYTATYVVDMDTGYTHMYEKNSLFRKMNDKLFVRGHYNDFSKTISTGSFVVDADKSEFDPVRDFEALKKTMSENQHYILSYRMVFRQQFLYYQTHFAMAYDGNKKYCIIALKNINDQIKKEIEQKQIVEDALKRAEVANESKSTFLSSMSHEIRTPINAILGMDEMIIRECDTPEIRAYARNIQNAGKTLLGIINDILDFSKIESGKMEIIPVEYDLASVVNDLINMIRPKAEEKALEFKLDIDSNTPALLYGDEIRIKQIVLNLLGNAVKYTEKGSFTLKIGYTETDSDDSIILCICVSDTGKGIKEEEMDKLFKPFERLDEYNNRSIEGTGLGISITQNLLNMMGSNLEVSSVYGEGSSFSCKIKQGLRGLEIIGDIEQKYHDSLLAESDYKESFQAPDAKILVVDDVQMNLFVVRDLLKTTKIQLDLALSGFECLTAAQNQKYDLILLDHMMPEMDGFETFERLKEIELNKETPVIILTANAISGAREQYLEAGFTDYLTKPIDSLKLEKMITKYLPGEKVITDIIEENTADKQSVEDSDILQKLSKIEYIDTDSGVTASGSEEIYLMVCKEFGVTGAEKLEQISTYYEALDISNYTIHVHGLKSVSRLLGYTEMSNLAADLEQAGIAGNIDTIQKDTPKLLSMLKQATSDLEELYSSGDNLEEISQEELIDAMNSILEVSEAFDFDSVDMIMGELDKYAMPDSFKSTYKKLKILVSNVDRDGIIDIITSSKNEWMGGNN